MEEQDKLQIQEVLEKEVDLFEVKEVDNAKQAIAIQPTAAETNQTIDKYEEELNTIGNFDLKNSSAAKEEEKKALHLYDDPEFLERKTAMI